MDALAEKDLEEIYLYIAAQSHRQQVAKDVIVRIRDLCDRYASFVNAGDVVGTNRSDLGDGVRCVTSQRWVILFRPVAKTLQVLAVYDGSREYGKLFQSRLGSVQPNEEDPEAN